VNPSALVCGSECINNRFIATFESEKGGSTAILRGVRRQHTDTRWPFSASLEMDDLQILEFLVERLCWRPTPERYAVRTYRPTPSGPLHARVSAQTDRHISGRVKWGMFFKSRVKPDDFANYLIREHEAIFGQRRLVQICKQFALRFGDERADSESLREFQTFGLYSIADGLRMRLGEPTVILTILNDRFPALWGHLRAYEEFGNHAPIGEFAAQRIFDRPSGTIPPNSQVAFDLKHAMNQSYLAALKAIERLLS
jgi:hypothetical protein